MATRKVTVAPLYRSFELDRAKLDPDKRSIPISFSSETPVKRQFPYNYGIPDLAGKVMWEILDHSPGAIDFSRFRALLVDHDRSQHIGRIDEPGIKERRGVASALFSRSAAGEKEFQDVKDGIRTDISVGYVPKAYEVTKGTGPEGLDTVRMTKWAPHEASLTAIGMDPTVGVGRSDAADSAEIEIEVVDSPTNRMADKPDEKKDKTPEQIADERRILRSEERKALLLRDKEIDSICDEFRKQGTDFTALARQFKEDDKPIEDFRVAAFEQLSKGAAKKVVQVNPEVGMSRKEIESYSLCRAILGAATNRGKAEGLEAEASRAVAKLVGREPAGFFLPHDVMMGRNGLTGGRDVSLGRAFQELVHAAALQRDMTASVGAQGGATIQTDVLGASLIEILRNKMYLTKLGARSLDGLVGDIAIPRQTGAAQANWANETGAAAESDQALNQLGLTPKRLTAWTNYSKQLLAQSTIDVEAFVREDLMAILAIARDLAGIAGTGNNNQPLGVVNNSGIGSVTFATPGTPLFSELISFETKVAQANADIGALAYLTSPGARGNLKALPKIGTTFPIFMWEAPIIGDPIPGEGSINGYRALATNQVPNSGGPINNYVVFGNWLDVIQASWAGLDIVVDPYSLATTGEVRIVLAMFCDMGLRHAGSMAASSNNAA